MKQLLDGVRVLDLGQVWAGAVCGQVLADFGADVIKVESRTHLDTARQGRPIIGDEPDPNQNPMFHNMARNKKSLALNLKTERGRELLRALASKADVLIENMRVGALGRMGLSYSALQAINPRIVIVSHSITGLTGPMTSIRGYGPTISSVAGLDALIGYEGEPPLGLPHPYADPNVGLYAALATLAALNRRASTGRGCHIDLSMWEAMVATVAIPLMDSGMNRRTAEPIGNNAVPGAPAGVFPCAGEDTWIAIEVQTDEEWAALTQAMGDPEWTSDSRFASVHGRSTLRAELNEHVTQWSRSRDRDALAEFLQKQGIRAAPCLTLGERLFDEHLMSRDAFVWIENPVLGNEPIFGQAARLSRTPGSVRSPAPLLGEHSREVLRDFLALSDGEIDALEGDGILQ